MNETFGKVTQVIKDHTAVALLQWAKKLQLMINERKRKIKELEKTLTVLKVLKGQVDDTSVLLNQNQLKLSIILRSIRSGLVSSNTYVPKNEYKEWAWFEGSRIACYYSTAVDAENAYNYVDRFRKMTYSDTSAITNLVKYMGGYNNES